MANAGAHKSRPPCGQPTHLSMTCTNVSPNFPYFAPEDSSIGFYPAYLDLDALAPVVHVDALAAGLLVAVVDQAHGGAEGRGEGADGLLAGAVLHVGGVLAVVVGYAGVGDGEGGGGEGGEEEPEGRHGWGLGVVWLDGWLGWCGWCLGCGCNCWCCSWLVVGGGTEEKRSRKGV